MQRQNILPKEVLDERIRRGAYLKKCRIAFLITGEELFKQTKIDCQTIYRMEKGVSAWMIDTEIRYILGVIILAKQKKYYHLRANAFPECSIEAMRKFLNQHQ